MNAPEEKNIQSSPDESNRHKPLERRRRKLIWAGIIGFGLIMFLFGYFGRPSRPAPVSQNHTEMAEGEERIRYWTCSMHPQIQLPEPGKCPICFMDLVPVYESARGGDSESPVLVLSETARQLAEIETAPVEYRSLAKTVRMVGKIEYDETKLAQVSAWVGGRIDKLYVNYVGARVKKGDPLILLYSPELRTAQEEYIIADRRYRNAQEGGDESEIASALAVKNAIEKKLELWGILPEQIKRVGANGGPDDHMTVHAPAGGTVIEREAFEGKYVQPGERLFSIADLSDVWANLDAYEIDLGWLRPGQTVEFETDVFPGEIFKGKITFIQPVLSESTRTIKVRVNVPNPDERLKPGMYVRAKLEAPVDEAGRALKPGAKPKQALSIPATAPLLTGKRAVVYVEEMADDEPVYSGRQVELGPRVGDYYLVRAGLQEGERVVTRGAFKIDAALQIQAKPSMMKPEGGGPPAGHQHGAAPPQAPARAPARVPAQTHEGHAPEPAANPSPPEKRPLSAASEMTPVLEAYFAFVSALANDDAVRATSSFESMREKAAAVDVHSFPGESHDRLVPAVESVKEALPADSPKDIASQRALLASLAKPIGNYLTLVGHEYDSPLFEIFCPMAFGGKGAVWYQKAREINNPYFGASMLRCGEIKRELSSNPGTRL